MLKERKWGFLLYTPLHFPAEQTYILHQFFGWETFRWKNISYQMKWKSTCTKIIYKKQHDIQLNHIRVTYFSLAWPSCQPSDLTRRLRSLEIEGLDRMSCSFTLNLESSFGTKHLSSRYSFSCTLGDARMTCISVGLAAYVSCTIYFSLLSKPSNK